MIFIIFDVTFGDSTLPDSEETTLKLTMEAISRFFIIFLVNSPREMMRYDLGLELCRVKGRKNT